MYSIVELSQLHINANHLDIICKVPLINHIFIYFSLKYLFLPILFARDYPSFPVYIPFYLFYAWKFIELIKLFKKAKCWFILCMGAILPDYSNWTEND